MRPAPSLHYVSTLLDQRRRRYHRARRLWGSGLILLGLLLVGWWVPLRLAPSSPPPAVVVSTAGLPALPSGATGMRMRAVEPRWGRSTLLELGVCQDCACQPRSPWRPACTLSDAVAPGCPTLPWCTTEPAQRPWELALPEREPWLVQTEGTLSDLAPPGMPAQGDHPTEPLSSPACAAAPCPAIHTAGRSESASARQPQKRRPRRLRPAGPQRPAQPVPPQRRVSDDAPPVLAEPKRPTASP
jgi:hypothetical protein